MFKISQLPRLPLVAIAAGAVCIAAIIQAVIPQVVPTANKRGTATIFALANSTTPGTAGAAVCDDGTGAFGTTGCTGGGPLFSQTQSVTVSGTAAETTVTGTGAGSLTLPATSFATVGGGINVWVSGTYTTSGTPGTRTWRLKIGANTFSSGAATNPTSGSGTWYGMFNVTDVTTGAMGTVTVQGCITSEQNGVLSATTDGVICISQIAGGTVNTTTTNAFNLTMQDSVTTNSTVTPQLIITTIGGGGGGGGGGSSLLSNVGAFSTRPGSGTNSGDLFSATDSPVSSIWTGAAWSNFAFHVPVTLPTTATFATAVNVTSSTQSATTGPLVLTDADSNVVARVAPVFTNTGVFFFSIQPSVWNSFQSGVLFRESATGKLVVFTVAFSNSTTQFNVDHWTNPTTFTGNAFRQTFQQFQAPFFAMRLRIVGAALDFDFSMDAGQHWTLLYTENKTTFFTTAPDQDGPCSVISGDVMTVYNYSTT